MHMDNNSDNLVLLCVKRANLEELALVEPIVQIENKDIEGKEVFSQVRRNQQQQAMLWRNLMRQTQDCYFWKDENRRFLGVSQAFLDYYGIKSLEDIVGKNDEEMHWHVDDQPYKSDELDVIAKGQVIHDALGNCIIKGIAHSIVCNKWPLYDRGRIVGLMGYFRDADRMQQRAANIRSDIWQDKLTGLMNEKSFYEVFWDYEEQMQCHGRKYGLILVQWEEDRSLMEQGNSVQLDEYLRLIADRLRNSCGKECSVARFKCNNGR